MKPKIIHTYIATVLILFSCFQALGQQNPSMFWLNGIPQSSRANPSFMPKLGFYIGMPGTSSLGVRLGHNGFALGDLIVKDQIGRLTWDVDNFLTTLNPVNNLNLNLSLELLSFGFRAGRSFWTFDVTEKVTTQLDYPRDLMLLFFRGNNQFVTENRATDLSGLGLGFTHAREIAIGYARNFSDRLSIGIRAKLVQGLSNVSFERSNISLMTDSTDYSLLLNADILANISLPSRLGPLNNNTNNNSDFEFDPADYISNFQNLGGALDLGVQFKPTDNIIIGLALNNIGFISWKSGVENFAIQGEYEFEGLDLVTPSNGGANGADPFEQLLDSLENEFAIEETQLAYRQTLPMWAHLSFAYDLHPRHRLGLVAVTEFVGSSVRPSFTFSYNFKLMQAMGLSLSYSYAEKSFSNLGGGFFLNMGPLQLYLVANNWLGAMRPQTLKSTHLNFGINWVFGYRAKSDDGHNIVSW